MSERELFDVLLAAWLAAAAASFVALQFVAAPYGRHAPAGARRALPARWGWLLMESPAVVGMLALYLSGERRGGLVATVFLALWLVHYVDRTLLYPFRLAPQARPLPLAVVASAFGFQIVNAYLNGRWLFHLAPARDAAWLGDPRFLGGAALFAVGFAVNRHADRILRALRRGGSGYGVPHGGLFHWVSCPNYLGEIVMWAGWALATWCLPAAAFALWTAANLVPRARSHQRWYRARFADYPARRRALVPGVW